MDRNSKKAWLYLLPSLILLGAFLIYPLIDVLIYSVEECYNFASQTYQGVGLYNYSYVLHDPYFLQAVQNTFILVIITVPLSTILALVISTALSSIKPLRQLFQTIYFLPYVTNTLAVGLVFMVLFQRTEYTDGLVNLMLQWCQELLNTKHQKVRLKVMQMCLFFQTLMLETFATKLCNMWVDLMLLAQFFKILKNQ